MRNVHFEPLHLVKCTGAGKREGLRKVGDGNLPLGSGGRGKTLKAFGTGFGSGARVTGRGFWMKNILGNRRVTNSMFEGNDDGQNLEFYEGRHTEKTGGGRSKIVFVEPGGL